MPVNVMGHSPLAGALRDALSAENFALVDVDVDVVGDDPRRLEEMDARAWRTGSTWLPVVPTCGALRIGPMITPHRTPCMRCLQMRHATTDLSMSGGTETLTLSSDTVTLSSAGYAQHHVSLAAALITGIVDASPARPARGVWLAVLSAEVTPFLVHSVHGCPRCGGDAYRRDSSRFTGLARSARPAL